MLDGNTKQRKSICFLTDIFIMGGMEKVLLDALHLLKDYYDISIVVLFGDVDKDVLKSIPTEVTVRLCKLKLDKKFMLISSLPVVAGAYFDSIIGNCKFDYLVSLKAFTIGASYSKCADKKIYWCHGDKDCIYAESAKLDFFRRINKIRLRMMYKKYHAVWTVTSEIADQLQKAFDVKRIAALHNPLDCSKILELANDPCEIQYDANTFNIVMCGRLSEEKGFDRMIRVAANIRDLNYHIYVIGDGIECKTIKKMITELDLSQKISMLGQKANPYPYIIQGSLLVCPSRTESFGVAMLEAMLLGVPVVTTSTCGGRYVTQNGQYGYCVDNHEDALQKKVVQLIENPRMISSELQDFKQWARQHDLNVFGANILKLLQSDFD